ncbi:dihydroorotate dehydrogenase (quinone) [Candidatus Saccharibacteria bacterium 32-50-13]|nr:MAG: dihydroorotate dehydrogenase (quinone) [Candidatus Saccharibacteria bacterium 32-50-13]
MIKVALRWLLTKIYRHIAKPILFRFQPDEVHHGLVALAVFLQRFSLVRWLLPRLIAHYEDRLRVEVAGLKFRNPIGLSAGFDKNVELVPMMKAVGFGFMEGGTVTNREAAGNPRPWFFRLPHTKSLVVHAGLANQGVERIASRIDNYKDDTLVDFPLFVSVAHSNVPEVADEATMIEDCLRAIKRLADLEQPSALTLNISCPNTCGGEPFVNPEPLDRLLERIDELQLKMPLFVKLPSYLDPIKLSNLMKVLAEHQVSGVVACNLAKTRDTVDVRDGLTDDIRGGLSGKPVQQLSDRMIEQIYREYGDRFVIIGVGGVFSAEDAYRKIKLGASLIQMITGVIFQGPQVVGTINHELAALLKRDGYNSVREAVGVDVKRS